MKVLRLNYLFVMCLIFTMIITPLSVSAADNSSNVVYLGVENYGTSAALNKDNLNYKFFVDGNIVTYKLAASSAYTVQNTLQEGYMFDITISGSTITKVSLQNGDVCGKITAVNGNSIQVGSVQVNLDASSKLYRVSAKAGGASVTSLSSFSVGDTVRVFNGSDGIADTIYQTFIADDYIPAIDGTPGVTTLKNFLATAMEPVGSVLYIFGGGWNWQDSSAGIYALTIDIPSVWLDFFQSHDAGYTYKNTSNYSASYYPHRGYNEYYYAGLDCSGYVNWVVYNVINTKSGSAYQQNGNYAWSNSTGMAKKWAQTMNWGTYTQSFTTPTGNSNSDFHVGDVFSMSGHVWICLGTCNDGSIVIMHSTPSASNTGNPGGGVQLSAINPKPTGTNCEAYKLADYYMSTYYPEWSSRYNAILKDYGTYTAIKDGTTAGKFSWDLSGTKLLSDPDGYASMTPAQILNDLFSNSNTNSEKYTVSFETDGGSKIANQNIYSGNFVSTPAAPVREGYIFDGWYTDSGWANAYDFNKAVSSSFTLYAKWNAVSEYNITASTVGDGQIAPSGSVKIASGESITFNVFPSGNNVISDLLVDGVSVGALSSYTFTNTNGNHTISAIFSNPSSSLPFSDVSSEEWYRAGVEYVYAKGLFNGTSASLFSPDLPLTRGMAVTVLYRLEGSPAVSGTCPFTDISSDDYYEKAVIWASENGIVQGYSGDKFAPEDNIMREQLVTILYRYADKKGLNMMSSMDLSGYYDVSKISDYAKIAMNWSCADGLIQGSYNKLDPQGNASRAQTATILMRFDKLN